MTIILRPPSLNGAKWTALVYMCADNGMSTQSYADLAEMTQAGSTADVNIVVQVDRAFNDSLPEPRRYYVEPGRLKLLDVMPELDMAEPATLADFVRFGKSHYPADNYLLILWDHGNGWPESLRVTVGTRQAALPLAIGYDWSSGRSMGVAGGMLRQAMNMVKQVLGRKLAILAFDACLMQLLEVACEVKDAVEIMVGSEDLVPYAGFPYDTFFKTLISQPNIRPRDYARLLPQLFVQSYHNGSQGNEPVTLSALDLTRLDEAQHNLDRWLFSLELENEGVRAALQQARRLVQTFSCEYIPPTRFDDNIDLIHFLELARTEGLAPTELPALWQATVLANAHNDPIFANARGLAIWFPDRYLSLKARHREYDRLDFARQTPWLPFLSRFFGHDDIKPLPANAVITPARHNNLTISWSRSYDLAPVSYDLYELGDCPTRFFDTTKGFDNWENQGFTALNWQGRTAFFSGISHYRDSSLTLRQPLNMVEDVLLSFTLWVNTRETEDTLGNFYRDVGYLEVAWDSALNWVAIDSFYGSHGIWTDCRYLIRAPQNGGVKSFRCRFRIRAGAGPHLSGFYISTVQVQVPTGLRLVAGGLADTVKHIFNHLSGTYHYFVIPRDSFGNIGFVSNLAAITLRGYAEPYTVPAPIRTRNAILVSDYPEAEPAEAFIYTLGGELVNRLPVTGRYTRFLAVNQQGKDLASGLYLVVIRTPSLQRIGRIAVVR